MSAIRAIVINDGEYEEIQLDGLTQMQQIVGGYIEAVSADDNKWTLWCNEEGKLEGLPVNGLATQIWWLLMPRMVNEDVLCGPVIVTGGSDNKGDTLPLVEPVANLIQRTHEATL